MKYSEYLFSSRQYSLAAEEYERLLFFDKGNINFKYYLIKSYRLSGDLNSGIKRIYSFYGNSPDTMPRILAKEFLKLQLLKDSSAFVESFISHNNNLSPEDKVIFHSFNLLLLGEYKNANLFVLENAKSISVFPDGIIRLSGKASKVKFKSPLIAAGFSAIIPGTGKFYTKNWSDGLFSMLFVVGNAWQAYRGFHEHGIKSGYGWVFAGLSGSFYIGNIFGSAKAAKRYNKNVKNDIDNQVFDFVGSDKY